MTKDSNNLSLTTLDDSIVTVIRYRNDQDKDLPTSVKFIGGIYEADGHPYSPAFLQRGNHEPLQYPEKYTDISSLIIENHYPFAVYGGIILNHYGHFLLETLARYWYLKDYQGDIIFHIHPDGPYTYEKLKSWQKEIFSYLFTDTSRIKIVANNIQFDKLIIPSPGLVIRNFFHQELGESLRIFGKKVFTQVPVVSSPQFKKLWLSRSALGFALVKGEAELEKYLQKEGFYIVHPEKITVAEQVRLYEQAELICGFVGSAFHTLILVNNCPAKVIHFKRTRTFNQNYHLVINTKKIDGEFIEDFFVRYDTDLEVTDAIASQVDVIVDLPGIWQFLWQKGYVSSKIYGNQSGEISMPLVTVNQIPDQVAQKPREKITKSGKFNRLQIINQLIKTMQAKTYLEIGIDQGQRLLKIQASLKVGIDDQWATKMVNNQQNPADLFQHQNIEFYPINNQLFLQNYIHKYKPFDLVFLKNQANFEARLRDLLAIIHYTHPQSLIMIDGTIPQDIFTSVKTLDQYEKLRQNLGIKLGNWQGDVYKILPFIHDFMPFLSYATLPENNGQTIIWKKQRHDDPIFNSMTAISDLSYPDFLLIKDQVCNFASLDQVIKLIRSS